MEPSARAVSWMMLDDVDNRSGDEIVREYFRRKNIETSAGHAEPIPGAGMGSIGAMRDDADLLDQAVEYAMQMRENHPWRLGPGE